MSRYDKRNEDAQVLKLVRAGHHLWAQLKNAKLGLTHRQETALQCALEIIWDTKRKLKAELAEKRSAAFRMRNPFREGSKQRQAVVRLETEAWEAVTKDEMAWIRVGIGIEQEEP